MADVLVIIVDTNPVWWGQHTQKNAGTLQLSQCLDTILVFANSYLMLDHKNQLAIIAAHTNKSVFLYPDFESGSPDESPTETVQRGDADGKYELFSQVNKTVVSELKNLILSEPESELFTDSLIAGAMSLALCYIHRLEKEASKDEELSSRILVMKGAPDNPSQYMNFMNVVFTTQKLNIMIDACVFDDDSSLLQQACDISDGIYLKVPQMSSLLQYLLWMFLPNQKTRKKLVLPHKAPVDYRAACFCHRNLIDVGHVCSVCLSIFCAFSPICSTCQTTFKFPGELKQLKKKIKK